jgi:putative N6-adenine-specific DNA methylase
MLRASGWDGRAPLTDPFCGSGTIPIEAALIARRIAPGLHRSFAFERWPGFDVPGWRTLVDEARGRILPRAPGPISGSDRDAGSIASAHANATRAGVADDTRFDARAISALPPFGQPGHLVANPPYGIRMGDRRSLRNLFARFGSVVADRCPGSTLTVLLAAPEHQHAIGLPLVDCFRTTSGGVTVRCLSGPAGPQASGAAAA